MAALSEPQPDDAWAGPTGFIHDVLYESLLKNHPEPEECEYYLCGPPLMIKAVRRVVDELGVPPEHVLFDDFGESK
jgi:Na+-transporting NADH:ubiquinone oxidoreductase subunit F